MGGTHLIHQSQIGCSDYAGVLLPGISGGLSEANIAGWGESGITECAGNSIDPGGNVGHRTENDCIATDFPENGEIAGDDDCATGQRLDYRQAETFGFTWDKHHCRPTVKFRELVARQIGELQNIRSNPQTVNPFEISLIPRWTDLDEFQTWSSLPGGCQNIEKHIDPLAGKVTANVQ